MSKRENRRQKKADKQARNARLGYCHGCGTPWTKLTYEHIPPARVQALILEKYLRFNPTDSIVAKLNVTRTVTGGISLDVDVTSKH